MPNPSTPENGQSPDQNAHEDRVRLILKAFESIQDGVAISDVTGSVMHVNAAFSKITGYPREEIIGKNLRILQSAHQSPSFYESMWQAIRTTGYWAGRGMES